ncbi:MAG: hypothetical protein HY347_11850, partial [candidate division NC10 bacterium]|nr:hypothetical protein [candidate division NC10 bacterium]
MGLSLAEAQPFAYVANFDQDNLSSGTVSVIDTATNTVTDTVAVGGRPDGLAAHPDGTKVYVANHYEGSNSISVIDTATYKVTTVPMAGGPRGVAVHPSGTRVYVSNAGLATVSVIDATTHALVTTIPVGRSPGALGLWMGPAVGSPVANAGDDQTVNEGELVILNGSGSHDPGGDPLTYHWTQIAGPPVSLDLTDPVHPTFIAPSVPAGGATLTFELTVSDGELTSEPDVVNIHVKNVNHPPVADAGDDQTKNEGSLVTLNGTGSNDPDGDAMTYTWSQVSGPAVPLSDATSSIPTFTAPLVGPGGTTLVFQLVVNDGLADSLPDEVVITVQNLNDPPACDLAQASPARLWPPDHKLLPVGIVGVSDPDHDQVTLTITRVTQDEP